MKILAGALDKSAMTLSALCIVHCLLLPLLVVLLPSIATSAINQEYFHVAMVICVLPISIYALTMGCKKHSRISIGVYGGIGLAVLVAAVLLGETHLNEVGEKALTTLGAIVIAFAHFQNFQLCKHSDACTA